MQQKQSLVLPIGPAAVAGLKVLNDVPNDILGSLRLVGGAAIQARLTNLMAPTRRVSDFDFISDSEDVFDYFAERARASEAQPGGDLRHVALEAAAPMGERYVFDGGVSIDLLRSDRRKSFAYSSATAELCTVGIGEASAAPEVPLYVARPGALLTLKLCCSRIDMEDQRTLLDYSDIATLYRAFGADALLADLTPSGQWAAVIPPGLYGDVTEIARDRARFHSDALPHWRSAIENFGAEMNERFVPGYQELRSMFRDLDRNLNTLHERMKLGEPPGAMGAAV